MCVCVCVCVCTIYSHRPIIVGPKVVRCAMIGPSLGGPICIECTTGRSRTVNLGLDIVVVQMCSRIPW